MVGNRETYLAAFDSLYGMIEGLDVEGYRVQDSDKWTRARRMVAIGGGSDHLETWVAVGDVTDLRPNYLVHNCAAQFLFVYNPDNDGYSQASALAAASSLMLSLEDWVGNQGERAVPIRSAVDGPYRDQGDYLLIAVNFSLYLPR